MQAFRAHLATRPRPGQIVDDPLRVCGIAERTTRSGRVYFCSMSRNDGIEAFDAIAGTEARDLVQGQSVRVKGCVLVRRGRPILVIGSLRPCSQRTA
jgi:hypothetical protein